MCRERRPGLARLVRRGVIDLLVRREHTRRPGLTGKPVVALPVPVQHWTAPGPINNLPEQTVQPDVNNNVTAVEGRSRLGRGDVHHVFTHNGPGSHSVSYFVDSEVEANTAETNIVGNYADFFKEENLRVHFQGNPVRKHHVITFRKIEQIETKPDINWCGMVEYDVVHDDTAKAQRGDEEDLYF